MIYYFIGQFDMRLLNHKITPLGKSGYFIIKYLVNQFKLVLTTPHILTEISNLSNKYNNSIKEKYFHSFSKTLAIFKERFEDASIILRNDKYQKFGLTDAAIASIARNKYLVITQDKPLSAMLRNQKIDVLEFSELYTAALIQSQFQKART